MAKANITGLWAIGWNRMTENWWNLVVAGIGLFGVVTGLLFIVYVIFKKVQQYRLTKDDRSKPLPKATAQYFEELKSNTQAFGPVHDSSKAPTSFGVFLGDFASPPTPNQARLLTTWDLVVLDPLRPGVLEGLSNSECTASQRVGRLDVSAVVAFDRSSGNHDDSRVLSILDSTIATKWRRPQDTQSPFTGILLANWQADLTPAVLNELIRYLKALNFDIWLEAAPPAFLTEMECVEIDISLTRGIICRNGTIMYNGDRRNYFQMNDMRRTQRALAKHMSLGGKTLMMWETIDDQVNLLHSVIQRSYNWCRFNTTVSWIGPESALKDADVAASKSIKGEPLGAMMWLKSNEVMAVHDTWRLNFQITKESAGHEETFKTLEGLIPNLASRLALMPSDPFRDGSQVVLNGDFDGTVPAESQKAPFSYSPRGEDYTGLGCFQLGLDASAEDFAELAEGQRRLKDLNLLDRIQPDKLREFAAKIQVLYDKDRQSWEYSPYDSQAVRELVEQLNSTTGSEDDILKVYTGMHSGFHHGTHHQYWGLHDVDPVTGSTEIYISLKTTDRIGTLLHTFLSSRQYTRGQCLMAEISLAEQTDSLHATWGLPDRFVKDIEGLSSTELLLLSQRLTFAKDESIGNLRQQIQALAENRLIEIPTVTQLRAQSTNQYLRDEITPEALIESRLAWHADRGCQHPDKNAAISVFRDLQARLSSVLVNAEAEHMSQMETVLLEIIKLGKIDAGADILALSIFCAFRKLALEEVYLEILDRNPLPNAHSDQAACFAEMFALGSQCETYFDMTSNVVGRILADKQQAYYMQHQPPQRDDKTTEVPTSYASTLVDEDPNYTQPPLPWYYQMTFLGIFAVPALIDILLLTTVGHGLYLSTNMAPELITMATAGLMFGLLLVGAIGTWIGNGGSYYLHSMAFPVMNMFVITRFIAGTAVCLVVGIGGMIVIGIIPSHGFAEGGIFLFYFFTMSTYLTMLATLAVYQFPGFMFQSGRINTVACMPILLISPIVTIFVPGHDIVVYPIVLSAFLVSLIASARKVFYKWGSWYLGVKLYSDTDIVNWYTEITPVEELPKGVTDLGPTPLPRTKVFTLVQKEMNRKPWEKPTSDKMIRDLAESYDATLFLMDWYCKYSRTKMPYPYSPTWNLQCKTAIDTLKEMQKGLKLHNAFVHWRAGGAEVWCGVLYFVIALMDKWVSLFTSGQLVGLSAAGSEYSLPVGFSLAYYLVAAVCLDSVASPLWAKANKKTNQAISSLAYLKQVAINDARARRNLYWSNWAKFFFTHVWGLAVAASLMWTFVSPPQNGAPTPDPEEFRARSRRAVIMFMAYVGAYTGLLCYQYNRIYTGSLAMADLMISAIVGILVGTLMTRFMDESFPYSSVIGLGTATWLSAILSIRTAKVGWPSFSKPKSVTKPSAGRFYYSALGPDTGFSQRTLRETYDALSALESEYRFKIDPSTHPGVEVMQILKAQGAVQQPEIVQTAFPSSISLVAEAASLWQSGNITIDLVPARHFLQQEQKLRAVSRVCDGQLHIMVLVGLDLTGGEWVADIRRNCKVIAESMVQAAAEARFAFSRDHSNLAELLAVEHVGDSVGEAQLSLPEGIKRQLEWSTAERTRIMKTGEQEVLRYLILGLDCDTEWDLLPEKVRSALLKRCLGEQCDITEGLGDWMRSRFCKNAGVDLETHFARSNLGASLAAIISDYAKAVDADYHYQDRAEPTDAEYQKFMGAVVNEAGPTADSSLSEKLIWPVLQVVHAVRITIKFFVVSIVADPEFQRELDYVIRDKSVIVRWPARLVLNGIWIYCKALQGLLLPHFMFYNREKIQTLRSNMKGIRTSIKRKRVTIDGLRGPSTGFFKNQTNGTVDFHHYSGTHKTQPEAMGQLIAINTYSDKMLLQRREEYNKETVSNIYNYEYQDGATTGTSLPSSRGCIQGERAGHSIQYDDRGYVTDGSYLKDGNRVDFKYYYRKHARFDDELLRADFKLAHITINVSWCVPPPKRIEKLDKWIPNPKVIEATFTQGEDSYHSKWDYEHRSHPIIETTLNGRPSETPDMITFDWFAVLKKPTNCSFIADNPLFSFSSPNSNIVTRTLGMNTKLHPVSTALARTHLWTTWKGSKEIDAATVRYLDEVSLRHDAVLRPYWAGRDLGQLKAASEYLESQTDAILARTDMDPEISSWSAIAYKYSDLCTFGQGGDARINTRTQASQMQDSDDILHVIAMDTGTWPIEGGGVSACRRDMVNDLKTIRWHVVAESANDYSVPKFQIERNVQSLSILPLWGLDYLTPIHGVFQDSLDAAVQQRSHATRDEDIKRNFFPILTSLVKCSRALKFTHAHIEESTRALLDLNSYFENRHWTDVWMSDIVRDKWHELWLTEDMENTRPISEWLDAERPTLLHLENALDMWHRYLFIFSLPVPERLPDVFQASHHFAGASFGVLCKMKRNCTFHVWDHCISWREVTVFLSSAMSFDSPFVCTSLMSLSRMTSTLILHYADVVLPCADFFNPGWEVEIGTQEGTLMHRNTYARKIDPVVNGITNMEKYKPIETIRSKRPTVTMLSHVRFVKDIKNAILAADIIVNDWGFTDYQLDIYGDMEKAPAYSVECKEILASKGLRDHVALKGLGNPSKVLEEAWIFLNSSISEGLPLAMGEAALFGVPVVCTDVGASFRVVTDPVTWKKFSAVVAPNDSYSLAKAQVNVLGMLDEWAEYTDEPENRPKLSLRPGKEEVAAIQQRMYDKAESRRKLGMMGRNNVINSFSSERYLREHEQLLWVGKLQSPSYLSRSRRAVPIFSKWGNKRESDSPSLLARSGRSMSRPTSTRAPSAYSFKIEPKSGSKYQRIEALDMV
jgi:glycosyltransferase involved in cell wall biosynthesis